VVLSRWVSSFFCGRGFSPLALIPVLHGRPIPIGLRPLSPCLHTVSALPVICFPEPLFAVSHTHCIAQHCTRRLLATLCSPSGLHVRVFKRGNVPVPMLSRPSLAWILSLRLSAVSRSRPLGRAWYYRTRFSLSWAQLLRPERLRTLLIRASLSTVVLCCKAVYGGRLSFGIFTFGATISWH
jgi:hypothetical protein